MILGPPTSQCAREMAQNSLGSQDPRVTGRLPCCGLAKWVTCTSYFLICITV
jgi:hypothetical protein